jgi:hypothetical protein
MQTWIKPTVTQENATENFFLTARRSDGCWIELDAGELTISIRLSTDDIPDVTLCLGDEFVLEMPDYINPTHRVIIHAEHDPAGSATVPQWGIKPGLDEWGYPMDVFAKDPFEFKPTQTQRIFVDFRSAIAPNCNSLDTFLITVIATPEYERTADTILCFADDIHVFITTEDDNVEVQWRDSATNEVWNIAEFTQRFETTTTLILRIGEEDAQCAIFDTLRITIATLEIRLPFQDTIMCGDGIAQLFPIDGEPGATYTWHIYETGEQILDGLHTRLSENGDTLWAWFDTATRVEIRTTNAGDLLCNATALIEVITAMHPDTAVCEQSCIMLIAQSITGKPIPEGQIQWAEWRLVDTIFIVHRDTFRLERDSVMHRDSIIIDTICPDVIVPDTVFRMTMFPFVKPADTLFYTDIRGCDSLMVNPRTFREWRNDTLRYVTVYDSVIIRCPEFAEFDTVFKAESGAACDSIFKRSHIEVVWSESLCRMTQIPVYVFLETVNCGGAPVDDMHCDTIIIRSYDLDIAEGFPFALNIVFTKVDGSPLGFGFAGPMMEIGGTYRIVPNVLPFTESRTLECDASKACSRSITTVRDIVRVNDGFDMFGMNWIETWDTWAMNVDVSSLGAPIIVPEICPEPIEPGKEYCDTIIIRSYDLDIAEGFPFALDAIFTKADGSPLDFGFAGHMMEIGGTFRILPNVLPIKESRTLECDASKACNRSITTIMDIVRVNDGFDMFGMGWIETWDTWAMNITLSASSAPVTVPEICPEGPITPPTAAHCDTIITRSYDLDIAEGFPFALDAIFTKEDGSPLDFGFAGPMMEIGGTFRIVPNSLPTIESREVVCDVSKTCHRSITTIMDVVRLNDGFDMFGMGWIETWDTWAMDIVLSSSAGAVAIPETCGPSSAPRFGAPAPQAPQPIAPQENTITEAAQTGQTMPCRRVLRRDPIPFANNTMMQDYVEIFHRTEQTGHVFAIHDNFIGEYYTVDSTCSWSYACDSIILIVGDHIRVTRTPPTRTKDLVRAWMPEVVYTTEVIVSNCRTIPTIEPETTILRTLPNAQPVAMRSVTLPATNLATAERVNDPSFEIPYPHLQYYSEEGCNNITIQTTRYTWFSFLGQYAPLVSPENVVVRDCEPVGPIGDFLANVTCDGVTDASFLVCDSILHVDSIQIITKVVEVTDFWGMLFYTCHDSISYRVDSIWTFTCWKQCPEVDRCDTIKISGDTIIHYIEDSIVVRIDTFYMIGNNYPQELCPVLDTMNIVMELIFNNETNCHILDTFRLVRLMVPRNHIRDTSVSQGDTLHLFAEALDPEMTVNQWWVDLTGSYFNTTSHDLILDASPFNAAGFRADARFLGDTLPMHDNPDAFRGDTVDMVLLSQTTFEEHNLTCITRDTVAIHVLNGFRIAGYISYDSFWMPEQAGNTILDPAGTPYYPHRPVGSVTIDLVRLSTNTVVATTVSDEEGFFKFEGAFPQDRYVLKASAPQKYIVLNVDGGVTAYDAALLNHWIVNRPSMPYREENNPNWTKRTMMYLAGNVDENMFEPYDYFGIDAYDVQQILSATVGNFQFPNSVPIAGRSNYETGHFSRMLADGSVVPVVDWKFSNDTIDLTAHIENFHMFGVMMGDADLSYYPEAGGHDEDLLRRAGAVQRSPGLDIFDTIFVNRRDQFINFPIIALQDGEVGAFQMILNMPSQIEVLNVTPGVRGDMRLVQNIRGDEVLFSWITNSSEPIAFRKGDVVANLVMKVNRTGSRAMRQIPNSITFEPTGYGVWNTDGRKITNQFRVALPMVVIDNTLPTTILDSIIGGEEEIVGDTTTRDLEVIVALASDIQTSKIINVIPNPMADRADVTYSIAEPAVVTLKLYNLLGVEIRTLINAESQDVGIFRQRLSAEGVPSGVYILRLETVARGRREIAIEKVIVNR